MTVRGFGRLDGDEGFAEVFFDEAFLADDAVPGGVVLGEAEARAGRSPWPPPAPSAASPSGRPAASSPPPTRLLDLLPVATGDAAAARPGRPTRGCRPRPTSCRRSQTVTRLAERRDRPAPRPASPRSGGRELDVELHEIALDLLGADAELEGPWSKGWQFSLSGPIYAGTNEIQRNIAAERVLGLPRR